MKWLWILIKLVDLERHHVHVRDEIMRDIAGLVDSSAFIGGEAVESFESAFAHFASAKGAVGVSNGTSALEISLRAAGVHLGDEVITQANSYFATVEAIMNVGAIPVLVDCDPCTGGISLSGVEAAISPRTKALVPVHLFGHMADMRQVAAIAGTRSLIVIEDAAQAHGSLDQGASPGALSYAACYSFFPGKNLGAWGDAGAITSNSQSVLAHLKKLRNHGRVDKYVHDLVGTNARLDPLQALVLQRKLDHLPLWNTRRAEVAKVYIDELTSQGFRVLTPRNGTSSSWHLFVTLVERRDELRLSLAEKGVETGVHYPVPLHRQPAIRDVRGPLSLPISERLAETMVSLPIHGEIRDDEVETVLANFLELARPAEV